MRTDWRISSASAVLLAAYVVPTWLLVAFRLMISPIHALYDRPNVAVAIFVSDHFHPAGVEMVRVAWLLALSKLTVVAFLALFVVLLIRSSVRRASDGDEALMIALAFGSVISFASMVMASQVHEPEAMRLHATELLLFLGSAIVLMMEKPAAGAAAVRPALQADYPPAPQTS